MRASKLRQLIPPARVIRSTRASSRDTCGTHRWPTASESEMPAARFLQLVLAAQQDNQLKQSYKHFCAQTQLLLRTDLRCPSFAPAVPCSTSPRAKAKLSQL